MINLELTIRFSNNNWVVESDTFRIAAPTLDELDVSIKEYLLNHQIIKKGEKAKLMMYFDNATIPEWIRQYAQHYFNRIVEIEG